MNHHQWELEEFLDVNPYEFFNPRKEADLGELRRIEYNIYILINAWFNKYISCKKPGYSLEEVWESIQFLRINDWNIISFLFLNPITYIHEEKQFSTIDFLEESRMMTSQMIERILWNSYNSSKK